MNMNSEHVLNFLLAMGLSPTHGEEALQQAKRDAGPALGEIILAYQEAESVEEQKKILEGLIVTLGEAQQTLAGSLEHFKALRQSLEADDA